MELWRSDLTIDIESTCDGYFKLVDGDESGALSAIDIGEWIKLSYPSQGWIYAQVLEKDGPHRASCFGFTRLRTHVLSERPAPRTISIHRTSLTRIDDAVWPFVL